MSESFHPPHCHNVNLLLVFLIRVHHLLDPSFIVVFAAILKQSKSTLKFNRRLFELFQKRQNSADHLSHLEEISNYASVAPDKRRALCTNPCAYPAKDTLLFSLSQDTLQYCAIRWSFENLVMKGQPRSSLPLTIEPTFIYLGPILQDRGFPLLLSSQKHNTKILIDITDAEKFYSRLMGT